jgi:hypothetical protein
MAMKDFAFLVIALISFVFSGCATEQKATRTVPLPQEKYDAPIWNVGDYWKFQYSDKRWWVYEVVRIEDNLYIIENPFVAWFEAYDKTSLELKFLITKDGKRSKPRVTDIYFDFPLYVGKKWNKMVTAPPSQTSIDISYLLEYNCISQEDVTVPAGTFKALKIKYKQTNMFGSTSGVAYIWWSPVAKVSVKMVYEKKMYWFSRLD